MIELTMWRAPKGSLRVLLAAILVFGVLGSAPHASKRLDSQEAEKPMVKVVSPGGAGFFMGSWAGNRVLITIEIIDSAGAGIETNDFGEPRFVDPNKNAEIFLDSLIARGSYVDGAGRSVIQLVSEVPTDNLKVGEGFLTPPVDFDSLSESAKELGFTIPVDALLEAVDFRFQVRDRRGVLSDVGTLFIAFAPDLFRGPYLPPPAKGKTSSSDPKRGEPESPSASPPPPVPEDRPPQ